MLIKIAQLVAERSTCNRRKVGTVLAKDGIVLSTGYVGAPRNQPHCTDVGCEIRDGGCVRTLHAEANAIAWSARRGIKTDGATLYSTLSPCLPCAKLLINAGIIRIVYIEKYRDPYPLEFLKQRTNIEILNYEIKD